MTEGQSLSLDGGLTGSGQVDIGAGANLTVEGVEAGSQNTIDFIGAGGVLTIPKSALNAFRAFLPVIAGFDASDAIDFGGTVTGASYAGGALTLYDGTTAVATLELERRLCRRDFRHSGCSFSSAARRFRWIQVPAMFRRRCRRRWREIAASGAPLAISGVGISNSTSGVSLSVTPSDNAGLLTVTTNAPGGGGAITGSGGKSVTIIGALAQINADLRTLTYQNSTVGSDSILVSANDGLGGVTNAEILGHDVERGAPPSAVGAYAADATAGPFVIVNSGADMGGIALAGDAGDGGKNRLARGDRPARLPPSVSASSSDAGALDRIAGGFDVSDLAAKVAANFDALNADANVNSILLIDFTAPTLSLDAAQALGDTTALSKIASPYTIAIADTAANVDANLAAIRYVDRGGTGLLADQDRCRRPSLFVIF